MNELAQNLLFFGFLLSIAAYGVGALIRKKTKLVIFNPLLIAVALVIAVLTVLDIDYDIYYSGARYLSYFVTPATVCLAVPLYRQWEALRKNWKAILTGILAGALTGLGSVWALARLFALDYVQYVTLLPKSVTNAIGMGISEELGGVVTLTAAVIVVAGIVGSLCAQTAYRLLRITDPVAKGVGLGVSAHAIGTLKALELGEVEGAMSSLSIVVTGLVTVVLAPVFAKLI